MTAWFRTATMSILAVGITALTLFAALPASAQGGETDFSWNRGGLGVWRYDSSSGAWVDVPMAGYDDPKQYRFELLCLVNNNNDFDKACLSAAIKCTEGEHGKAVRWFESLKAISPPIWAAMRPDRCMYSEKPADVLDQIAGRILSDFRTLPIKPAALGIQPSPHTLRGAETNVFADAVEQRFDVVILGQKVRVVATPTEYTYSYGDGGGLGPTMFAGGPLPEEQWGEKTRTSHVYKQTGDFQVSVSTTFRGTYSVNGGPDLPIPGTGEFASPAQTVSVWRSVTRNYADNCLQNPQGEGCPGVPSK